MSTISEIMTAVKDRTGLNGTTYDAQIIRAINRAGEEIASVNWQFLYIPNGYISITTAETQFLLPENFSRIDEDNVYIGTLRSKLYPGNITDIAIKTSGFGTPHLFCVCGTKDDGTGKYLPTIYVGCQTSLIDTTLYFAYWRKHGSYTVNQTPLISDIYGDMPLISGACSIVWKELEQNAKAQDAFLEFCSDMRVMESKLPFIGNTYDEIIALRPEAQSI